MIERKVISKKLKELQIKEYMANTLDKPGYSHIELTRTPLGEKITVFTSKPGLIVGSKGSIIKELTEVLKRKFNLENPQIEVSEISTPYLNPNYITKHIVHTFERFGPSRFKFLGHKLLESIMDAGARGAEIVISGRGVPSKRSKTWRFSSGHLKKSGDIFVNHIKHAYAVAHLKSGAIGIKASILTPDVILPDEIIIRELEKPKEVKIETLPEEPKDIVSKIKEKKTEDKSKKKTETKKKAPKSKKDEIPKAEELAKKKEIQKQEEKKTKKKDEVPKAEELAKKKEEEKEETKEEKPRKIITSKDIDEKVPSILELAEQKKWQS